MKEADVRIKSKDVGISPDDPYQGWLKEVEERGRVLFVMGTHATRHRGELLSAVPGGYLRSLLDNIPDLPGPVRAKFLEASGAALWDPAGGKNWVPVLIGDRYGSMHPDSHAVLVEQLERLERITGQRKLGPLLEYLAANLAATPDESLG